MAPLAHLPLGGKCGAQDSNLRTTKDQTLNLAPLARLGKPRSGPRKSLLVHEGIRVLTVPVAGQNWRAPRRCSRISRRRAQARVCRGSIEDPRGIDGIARG